MPSADLLRTTPVQAGVRNILNGNQSTVRQFVFVAHSTRDEESLADLRRHIDPLFDSSPISIWEDSMLYAGVPWDPAIRDAMSRSVAVILLVSDHLLQSKYVRNTEIPEFLRRAEESGLRIYCLHLTHSVVDQVDFHLDVKGRRLVRRLTEYQGLNSPANPLSDNKRNRTRILAAVAKRVYSEICGGKAT